MTSHAETSPGPWIAALRQSHDRLRGLATPLTAEDLVRRSYDTEWSIADVLSHIGSGAEIFGLFLAAAKDGSEAPGREAFQPIWDRWNAKGPTDQAADALATDGALVAALEALDADQLASIRMPLMGMDADVTGMARMRLSEHALHTWDVDVALNPAATVGSPAVGLLVDILDQSVGYAGKPSGLRATVRVRTADPVRDLALSIGEAVAIGPWPDGEATAELYAPAEAFVRLISGRLDADHAADVKLTGLDLADLRAVFPGY